MAGSQRHQLTLTSHGEPQVIDTSVVTADFFSVFGANPIVGRAFFPDDGKPGAPPVAVLSENLWRSDFASDPNIAGTSIALDKKSFTIIGVMPSAFRFPSVSRARQIWIPLAHDPLFGPWMPRRGGHWLQVTGRLKPGVTQAQAKTEFDSIAARLAKNFPQKTTAGPSAWSRCKTFSSSM